MAVLEQQSRQMTNKSSNLFPVYVDKGRCFSLVVLNIFFIHNRSICFGIVCRKFYLEGFHSVDTKKWCQFHRPCRRRSSLTEKQCWWNWLWFKELRLDTDALQIFRTSEKHENRGGIRGLVWLHSPHHTNICNSQCFILVSHPALLLHRLPFIFVRPLTWTLN